MPGKKETTTTTKQVHWKFKENQEYLRLEQTE